MLNAAREYKQPAVIILLTQLLVSCGPLPETRVDSPVPVPEHFSDSGANLLPDKWWLDFADPVLDGLIEQGIADNLNLRSIWDRLAQAEAAARQQGALLFPAVDAEAAAARTERSNGGNDQTDLSLGLAASYELDLWGRIRSTRDAAKWDVFASRTDLTAAAITLSAAIAGTWYQLVEQYGQIDLLNRQLTTNEQVLDLVTLRFRRGQTNAADVLQQRQLVESNRGDIITAESRAGVLEHQLAVLVGRTPDTIVAHPVMQLVELPPIPATGLPSELIERRPDIRESYYNILASDRRLAAAIANRFPRINLTGSVNTSGATFNNLFDVWLTSLASSLVAPLVDGGARKAEVDRTRAVLSERLHEYGQTILESLAEVEDALIRERKQKQLIHSLDKQLELSDLVIQRIRDSYAKGAVDYLRVLDTLLRYQALQRSRLQAQRQLLELRIELCRTLAGGWELQRPNLAELNK